MALLGSTPQPETIRSAGNRSFGMGAVPIFDVV